MSELDAPTARSANGSALQRAYAKPTLPLRATSTFLEGMEDSTMPLTKQASKRKRRKEVVPALGVVGVSLSLAGGASAATAPAADVPSSNTAQVPEITLNEEEISDVSLGTFYVFDKENTGSARQGEQVARGCGGCRGCAEAAEAAEAAPEVAEVAEAAAAEVAAAACRGESAASARRGHVPITRADAALPMIGFDQIRPGQSCVVCSSARADALSRAPSRASIARQRRA